MDSNTSKERVSVLSIGTDRKLFDEKSGVASRIIEYGELFEELHIVVFCLSKHKFEKTKLSEKVTVYPTNAFTRLDYILNAYAIAKDILAENPGQFVVSTQDPFECGLVGYLLKRKSDIKLNIQMHGDFWSPFYKTESFLNKCRLLISKIVIPKADCIRVVSERVKKGLKKAFNPSVPMVVLPIAEFREESKVKESKDLHKTYPQYDFIALMASRLEQVKNIELALYAFKGIVDKYPKAGLIISGDGTGKAYLENLVEKLSLRKNVIFLGWQKDIASYMSSADVFLNTSNHEGYCLSLVEAAKAKCPIITTDVGVVGEMLNESNTLVCPVGEQKCIESRLSIAIENKEQISKLGEEAFISVIKDLPRKESYLENYKKSITDCI